MAALMPRLVSIALPTYNGATTVEEAVRSAQEQDYEPIEIVVTDDESTDGTAALIQAMGVEVHVNARRLGANENWNESVRRSRGEFVKFLHQDDRLGRNCVSRMVSALEAHPSAGMVFCRRRVAFDGQSAEGRREWLALHGSPHEGFADLRPVNDRGVLLEQMLSGELRSNWFGEPVCVMVRRSCMERLGGFHRYARQTLDLDLWLRIAAHYEVAFIDEELVTYRVSADSLTALNRRERLHWLDRLWTLEGLAEDPQVVVEHPRVRSLLAAERRMTARTPFSRRYRTPSLRPWLTYVVQRVLLRRRLYGLIPPR
jgi:glycosyltransferase involved in cell wall biosynthesis